MPETLFVYPRAFAALTLTVARALNLYLPTHDGNRFSENRCFGRP